MSRGVRAVFAVLALALLHSVARAGTGWYLIYPPVHGWDPQLVIGSNLPFKQWQQEGVFDTAASCDAARTKMKDDALSRIAGESGAAYLDRVRRESTASVASVRAIFDARFQALCIASDDPRLR